LALVKIKVPESDHLMRFVPKARQHRDPDTDEFKGILGVAFHIWPKDDGGLSTTWVEHYGAKSQSTYGEAASKFRDSLPSKKIGKQSYFAIGQVGNAKAACLTRGKKIRIVHAPDGPNTGHVELRQFSDEDQELLEILAEEVFSEHVAVASLVLS
jgi:hypothetical protein